jgi:hypothetical protein
VSAPSKRRQASSSRVDAPEADPLLDIGRAETKEGADVDAPVEDEQRPLKRQARIPDNALAGRERMDLLAVDRRLVGDQGGNGWLDKARRQSEDEDRDYKRCEAVATLDDGRQGGDDEDNVRDDCEGRGGGRVRRGTV